MHVVGAGTMGAEIAAWCAIKGFRVTIGDVEARAAGKAVKAARQSAKDAHLSDIETRDALDRLMPDPKDYGMAEADLIIEAAPEKPELKREFYASIEKRMQARTRSSPPTPRASNWASLPMGAEQVRPLRRPAFLQSGLEDATWSRSSRTPGRRRRRCAALSAFVGAIDQLPAPVADLSRASSSTAC